MALSHPLRRRVKISSRLAHACACLRVYPFLGEKKIYSPTNNTREDIACVCLCACLRASPVKLIHLRTSCFICQMNDDRSRACAHTHITQSLPPANDLFYKINYTSKSFLKSHKSWRRGLIAKRAVKCDVLPHTPTHIHTLLL